MGPMPQMGGVGMLGCWDVGMLKFGLLGGLLKFGSCGTGKKRFVLLMPGFFCTCTAHLRRCRPLCTAGCFCHACYVS